MTARQLVSTAPSTPMSSRSCSNGIATTLDANTGAASRPPSASQASNSQPCSARTTTRRKSAGVLTGAGAKVQISAAEVITQPVPASASSRPNTTMRWSRGFHAATAVPNPAGSPRSRARLIAYSPVAITGATSMKPVKAPPSSQKRSGICQHSRLPNSATAAPCSRPGQGQRRKSRQPATSQSSGLERRTCGALKWRDSVRAALSCMSGVAFAKCVVRAPRRAGWIMARRVCRAVDAAHA